MRESRLDKGILYLQTNEIKAAAGHCTYPDHLNPRPWFLCRDARVTGSRCSSLASLATQRVKNADTFHEAVVSFYYEYTIEAGHLENMLAFLFPFYYSAVRHLVRCLTLDFFFNIQMTKYYSLLPTLSYE